MSVRGSIASVTPEVYGWACVIEAAVRPSGPYSLRVSARLAGDATRRFRGRALFVALPGGEAAAARQRPDGVVEIRAESGQGVERLRWMLALGDDHSEFLERFWEDPLLGRAVRVLKGLRPVRLATVAQSLLRALAGQLVTWQQAKDTERNVIRRVSPRHASGLYEPPSSEALARLSAAELRSLGLHARRAATLLRLCRSQDLERWRELPTAAVVGGLERERGIGPWSAGVVCVRGLGRPEYGLVGDLGLLKLCAALTGRPADVSDTAELLAPYGEWAGLASVYLLAALGRGLVPVAMQGAA
jgi:3-methyladenine DNA glycosylase/8-oxoguanine DNA glycosylase